jgi:NADH-quinone oxidoreductase subunit N
MVGMIYERCHTRELAAYGGIAKILPVYSVFLAVLTLAAIGLPTTSGFTGEFLVLLGAFRGAWPQFADGFSYPLVLAGSAVAGVVLGALYMLGFAQKFLFGAAKAPHQPFTDLTFREGTILVAILAAVFVLGLFPDGPMKSTELAARQYRELVSGVRTGGAVASPFAPLPVATLQTPSAPVPRTVAKANDELGLHRRRHVAGAPAARRHRGAAGARDRARHAARVVRRIACGRDARHGCGSVARARRSRGCAVPGTVLGRRGGGRPARRSCWGSRCSSSSSRATTSGRGAFSILLLSSLYGVCLLLSSDSFLTLFLGLELMSLPVYVLVLLAYRRPEAAEAALKYLVLGGTGTATLLMGASLVYGGTGSLSFDAFHGALQSADTMARIGVLLVLAAFFVKAAIVPFHAWAPDAYEGASIPVTAYMATIVKAGVLLAAVRLIGPARLSPAMADAVALLPLVSIVWGNLAAMRQRSFRRMIAYSSIAHAGYLFFAFLGDGPVRFQAVAFYVLAYGIMNVLALAALPRDESDAARDHLDNLRGLYRRAPAAAVMIGIAMVSLAGIPPFPGFIAKFLIFKNAIAAGYTLYAVLGLVGSYLGIYFYLRVIQLMFMSTEDSKVALGSPGRVALGTGLVCLVAAILLSVFPGWVMDLL